jgi:hypothetical protein
MKSLSEQNSTSSEPTFQVSQELFLDAVVIAP